MNSLKKWLVLLLLSGSSVFATTDYYVATTGSDGSGVNGSSSQPWKTVAYAASRVTGTNSRILVGSGTFAETATAYLNPGVSLEGAGEDLTTITTASSGTNAASILLYMYTSGTVSIDGNQSVSNVTFDGNNHTSWAGVGVMRRNNVTMHDITIKNCYNCAVFCFGPGASGITWPTSAPSSAMMSNLQIYNCFFSNSALCPSGANWQYGSLYLSYIKDSSIHHCDIDETGGWGGYCIKGTWGTNVKIHNNSLAVAPTAPSWSLQTKSFSLEFWKMDSCEVFDNTGNGGFSIYTKNTQVHHNRIIQPASETKTYGFEFGGINSTLYSNYIEGGRPGAGFGGSNTTAYNNVFRNCASGFHIDAQGTTAQQNLTIANNTFDHCGNCWYFNGIGVRVTSSTATVDNLKIVNNIFTNTPSTAVQTGVICLSGSAGATAVNVANITNTLIANNLFYNNGTNIVNVKDWGATNVTQVNSLTADPCFVGGTSYPSPAYMLSATSPALNSGTYAYIVMETSTTTIPYLTSMPCRGAFVQDESFTSGSGARVESEMNYSVVADVGDPTYPISVEDLALDSCKSVSFFTNGDIIRVHFYVPADGYYSLWTRIRSGDSNGPTSYWPVANGNYVYKLDSFATVTLTGDTSSVSAYDTSAGGVYWGTMKSGSVFLTQGLHSLEVQDTSMYTLLDYFELHEP